MGRRKQVGTARLGLVCLWCVCAAGAAVPPQARLAHLVHAVLVVSARKYQHGVRGQALQLGAATPARPTAPLGQLAHSGRPETSRVCPLRCDAGGRRQWRAVRRRWPGRQLAGARFRRKASSQRGRHSFQCRHTCDSRPHCIATRLAQLVVSNLSRCVCPRVERALRGLARLREAL